MYYSNKICTYSATFKTQKSPKLANNPVHNGQTQTTGSKLKPVSLI